MIPSLIILAALLVTAIVLYSHHRISGGERQQGVCPSEPTASNPEECCGLHEVCDKFPPSPAQPVYYDDEELDAFAGRAADDYTDSETEQFRDVLLTLLASDVYGWKQSMEARGINLPTAVQEELMLRLSENS